MIKIVVNYLFIFVLFSTYALNARGERYPAPLQKDAVPFIGAQIFIEPGQSPEDIDTWFRQLKKHHMSFCRIRMFERYMRDEDYKWDFSLFDEAFKAGEKYGIHIYATLFPYTEKTDIGGFKFPRDQAHLNSVALFIEKAVPHFSRFKSLYGWVLINEPGTGGQVPDNEFASLKYDKWLEGNPQKEYTGKGYPILVDFARENFLLDYNTWFLNWIAEEIKKYDRSHDIHVNNHAIFSNVAEYNFPEWRKFLTSLGGSAHPSWHFSYFPREKYAVAMSANCEINYSGAGNVPWLMTELQGGNNTYSGGNPMCPTKEEIAQWLWIITGTEAKGTIFWTLNPRSSGIEAGEWALLDFQDNPTDRMAEAAKVAKTILNHSNLFARAKKVDSGINLIYARESLWAESKMVLYANSYEGRNKGAVMKSVLGYFEALSEMGIAPNLKALDEYNFSENDYSGETIILTHQVAIPGNYADSLELFVSKGGMLLVDGLTAFFDENMHNTMKTGFDFQNLFGGQISEFKLIDNIFNVEIDNEVIPAHLWKGIIKPDNGLPLFGREKEVVGIRNNFGKGKVVWIPSLVGLGGRIKGDFQPLQKLLTKELASGVKTIPVRFAAPQKMVLMKTLQSGDSLITILVNKDKQVHDIALEFNNGHKNSVEIYPEHKKAEGNSVRILPEETKVILWN